MEDAVGKVVEAITDADIAALLQDMEAQQAKSQKIDENPETLDEYRAFIVRHTEAKLSDEQLATYDRLEADWSRDQPR